MGTGIRELLRAEPSPEVGRDLVEWVRDLAGRILRGDMMLGILTADEVALAPTALRRAAGFGCDTALLDLGNWLASPPFGDPDPAAARDAYREAIAKGVPGAKLRFVQFLWFHCRDAASGEEKQLARSMAEELTRDGEAAPRALHLLGLMTCAGFGTPADPTQALAMQTRAAELGDADAMFEAYLYHETGIGTERDPEKALAYLASAAEKGQPRAMYNLAACLATGRGMPMDLAKAAEWYSRASDAGNVRATANLAMYAKGQGVPQDLEHAAMLFDEAEYMGLDVSASRESVGL